MCPKSAAKGTILILFSFNTYKSTMSTNAIRADKDQTKIETTLSGKLSIYKKGKIKTKTEPQIYNKF